MRRLAALLLAVALPAISPWAQEVTEGMDAPPPPGPRDEAPADAPPAPEATEPAPAQAAPSRPPGDTITFKSGAQLRGLQIVRESSVNYTVEVLDSGLSIRIRRDQVQSVDYDDYQPGTGGSEANAGSDRVILRATEVSPEMMKKLNADISEPPLAIEQMDFVDVLTEVSNRSGVPIEIGEAVQEWSTDQRNWTYDPPPSMDALDVLEALQTMFTTLRIVYEDEGVRVTTRENATPPAEQSTAEEQATSDPTDGAAPA